MARLNKMITLSPAHHAKANSMGNFSGWIAGKLNGEDTGPQPPMKSWAQLLNMIGEHYGFESEQYKDFMDLRTMIGQVGP